MTNPRGCLVTLALALTLLGGGRAVAQEPAPSPSPLPSAVPSVSTGAVKLKVGGEMFLFWTDNLTKGAHDVDAFDVSRAHVNLFPTFGDRLDGRMTTDVTRVAVSGTSNSVNAAGSLVVRLKYAYLDYHVRPELEVVAGLQQAPWITWEEDIWQYRGLSPMGLETFFGDTSADFGFSAKAHLFDGRLDLHGGVFNGEFYQHPETNKYKAGELRATWQILPGAEKTPGLRVHAFLDYGLKAQNAERVRAVGMISFETPLLTAAAEGVYAQDGTGKPNGHTRGAGETAFAFVNLPWKAPDGAALRVLARVDVADPNTKIGGDAAARLIAGIACLEGKYVQTVLDYQQTDPQLRGAPTARAAFVHFLAHF